MNSNALLLVAHGSKDPEWFAPFAEIEASVKKEFTGPTVLTYLESFHPDLEEGVNVLLQQGVTHITVAPLFFAPGSHVRRDIPNLVEKAAQSYPGVTFELLPAIGQIPSIQKHISEEIVSQASQRFIPRLTWLNDEIAVSAQIGVVHVSHALDLGFKSIICNRPDEEEGEHQTPHQQIANECSKLGIEFTYFPVSPSDHSEAEVRRMRDYLNVSQKPMLIYCRSGRRSKKLIDQGEQLFDLYHPESFG